MTSTDSEGQRTRTYNGLEFEREIFEYVRDKLKDVPYLTVAFGKRLATDYPEVRRLLLLHTPAKSVSVDADVIIIDNRINQPVVIVSCKTTARERPYQSFYCARVYRSMYPRLVFCFVTEDNDKRGPEWGTDEKPRLHRVLCTYENIFVYSRSPRTKLGGCVRKFSDLIPDIKRCVR
jgi:hypothetical protein